MTILKSKMADNANINKNSISGSISTNTTHASTSSSKNTSANSRDIDAKQKSGGASLADFLLHLDDYTPTV